MCDERLEPRKVSFSGISERSTSASLARTLAGRWIKIQWLNLQRRKQLYLRAKRLQCVYVLKGLQYTAAHMVAVSSLYLYG